MHVLALDTSTPRVSVAIGTDAAVRGSVSLSGDRRHAEQLAPAIRYLLDETGIALSQLAAVAVGVGPGLFTGLRVGVTTAIVMAQALHVPVVDVPSLDLLAYPLRQSDRRVVTVIDARRREVFYSSYRTVPGGVERVGDYRVATPAAVVAEIEAEGDRVLLVGDGVERYREEFHQLEHAVLAGPEHAAPDAGVLISLATARVAREEFSKASDVRPLYVRDSDVAIAWETIRG